MAIRSADYDVFQTEGKAMCRRLWDENASKLFGDLQRPLKYVWLANNQFTDIETLLPTTESFRVPDNNNANRAVKRRVLRASGVPDEGGLIELRKGISEAVEDYSPDVVNLDLCNHLDLDTLEQIDRVINTLQDNKRMMLFASITQCSMRSMSGKRFPKYKRLAGSQKEIAEIIDNLFSSKQVKSRIIEGFPLTYQMHSSKVRYMYSFGWELTK